jgi:hypothetical protein
MAKLPEITFDNGCVLNIAPILSKDVVFIQCTIKESILGEVPEIDLILKSNEDICKINDKVKGYLLFEANKTEFTGYVYSVDFAINTSTIKILCVEPDFIKKARFNRFESMDSAVKGLYFGDKIVSNARADALSSLELYQKNLTNYKFLTKILQGYKKDTIFGYALGELKINDLKNWKSKKSLAIYGNIKPLNSPEFTDPNLYSKETSVIDYSNNKDPNHTIIKFHDKHVPINRSYGTFVSNIQHNNRFLTTKAISNYSARELFPITIADSVEVTSIEMNIYQCFISSRIVSFTKNKMEVFYTIQSINPSGE